MLSRFPLEIEASGIVAAPAVCGLAFAQSLVPKAVLLGANTAPSAHRTRNGVAF